MKDKLKDLALAGMLAERLETRKVVSSADYSGRQLVEH
jgi:hypothetical protein